MKKHIILVLFIVTSFAAFSQVEKIIFNAPYVYPEGIAYDKKGHNFYVSSVKTGTIGKVDSKGNYSELYKDAGLKSSFGMKIDEKKNQLFVCIGDPNYSVYADSATYKKMGRVIGIDMNSGKKIMDVNLAALMPGKHFPNDIAFDDKSNAYITDSFAGAIYKVDAKNNATVFAKSDKFKSIDVGLNGIVYHPDGYLLVAHSSNGSIIKVDQKDPTKINVVKIASFFPGADGLLFDEKNDLVVVQNKGVDKVFLLTTKDNWLTAEVEASTSQEDRFQNPTTAARTADGIYILNSKMNELMDSTRTPSKDFSIQRAMFKPVK